MKDSSGIWNSEELRRDVRTTLGTTKWQVIPFSLPIDVCFKYILMAARKALEIHRKS